MASPLLDFKKFKHVKSDDKSTTLQHKDGHTLTINHNALSKSNQAQLKALAKIPGETATSIQKQESDPHYGKTVVKNSVDSTIGQVIQKAEGGIIPEPDDEDKDKQIAETTIRPDAGYGRVIVKSAEGGAVPCPHCGGGAIKKYAEGAQVENSPMPGPDYMKQASDAYEPKIATPDLKAKRDLYNQEVSRLSGTPSGNWQDTSKYMFGPGGEQPASLDPEAWKMAEKQFAKASSEKEAAANKPSEKDIAIANENEQRMKAGMAPVQGDTQAPAPAATQPPPVVPESSFKPAELSTPGKPAAEAPDMYNQDMLGQAYKQGMQGAQGTANAIGKLGEAQALAHEDQAIAQRTAIQHYEEDKQSLNQERLGHIQAIQDGKIDPEKYWDNHSKLMTGIGLILAGFNPTSNPNAASNFLKSQMEANLTSQAKNLDSQQNLLSANLRQFGNLRDAADMTRVMQADYVSHKLGEAAAKAQTPMAQAAALTAQSQINKEFQPLFMNLNMRRAVMNLASSGQPSSNSSIEQMIAGLNSVGNPLGKQLGEAYIPGVGISRTLAPVPEGTKQEVLAMKILDDKGKDVLNYIDQHKGIWNSEKDKGVVAQKVEEMKNFYNNSIKGGALTEGRLGWYDEQFSKHPLNAVSQFLGSTDKLKEMVNSNGHRLNMTLDQAGINPLKSAGIQQQPAAQKVTTGTTIVNKQTGQRMMWDGKKWSPK